MEASLHSVLVKGNLNDNGCLTLQIPHAQFTEGLWALAIRSIGYTAKEPINQIALISSNYNTDYKITNEHTIQKYNTNICMFHMKAIVNECRVAQFDSTWFVISPFNEYLVLFFRSEDDILIRKNIDVSVLVLIKQIR